MAKYFWVLWETLIPCCTFLKENIAYIQLSLLFSVLLGNILRHTRDKLCISTSFIIFVSLKFSCVSVNSGREKNLLVCEKAPIQITALMEESNVNCWQSKLLLA